MIAKPYQGKPLRDTFPKLQRFLHFRMPLTPVDDFRIWKIFLRHSQLSPREGWQVVNWGKPPYLEVKELPKNVYGMFQTPIVRTVLNRLIQGVRSWKRD